MRWIQISRHSQNVVIVVRDLLIDTSAIIVPCLKINARRQVEVADEVAVVQAPPRVRVSVVRTPPLRRSIRCSPVSGVGSGANHIALPRRQSRNRRERTRWGGCEGSGRQNHEVVAHRNRIAVVDPILSLKISRELIMTRNRLGIYSQSQGGIYAVESSVRTGLVARVIGSIPASGRRIGGGVKAAEILRGDAVVRDLSPRVRVGDYRILHLHDTVCRSAHQIRLQGYVQVIAFPRVFGGRGADWRLRRIALIDVLAPDGSQGECQSTVWVGGGSGQCEYKIRAATAGNLRGGAGSRSRPRIRRPGSALLPRSNVVAPGSRVAVRRKVIYYNRVVGYVVVLHNLAVRIIIIGPIVTRVFDHNNRVAWIDRRPSERNRVPVDGIESPANGCRDAIRNNLTGINTRKQRG